MFSLLGKKVGMTQIFSKSGDFVSTTAIEVSPNIVVDVKTPERNGYSSVVVGYGEIREKLLSKSVLGQYKKNNLPCKRNLFELKGVDISKFNIGDFLSIKNSFKIGDLIDVQGITRGHGFTGAIKKWNFSCGPRTHGAGYPHRFGGSLETGRGGASAQKVWKGKKMAGRYGRENVTAVNLEVIHIDEEKNLLFVKGSIPGRKNSVVKMKITSRKNKSVSVPFEILDYERN